MKNHFLFSMLTLLSATSLLATAGCSDRSRKGFDPIISSASTDPAAAAAPAPPPAPPPAEPPAPRPPAPVTPAPEPSVPGTVTAAIVSRADPFVDIALTLDNTTRDTTAGLSAPQEQMGREIDAQIAAWKAKGATNTALAEEKLALARTDFAQKLRALSLAGDDTWRNAKSEAQLSLQNLRRVYGEYMAGPVKN